MGENSNSEPPTEQDFLNALREAVTQGNFRINPNNFAGWQDTCSCEKCRSQIIIFEFITGLKGQQMPEGLK